MNNFGFNFGTIIALLISIITLFVNTFTIWKKANKESIIELEQRIKELEARLKECEIFRGQLTLENLTLLKKLVENEKTQ